MNNCRRVAALGIAVVFALLPGCGSGDETDSFRLVPVTGTVTLNGKPLEGATVSFVPDGSNTQQTPGTDMTGPEGNYKLFYRGRSGVAPGKYKVTITREPQANAAAKAATAGLNDDPYMAGLATGAGDPQKGQSKRIEQTFDREVPAKGGVQDFDVKASAAASKGP